MVEYDHPDTVGAGLRDRVTELAGKRQVDGVAPVGLAQGQVGRTVADLVAKRRHPGDSRVRL